MSNLSPRINTVDDEEELIEPESSLRYKMTGAYTEDSNQSALPNSLIRVLVFCL